MIYIFSNFICMYVAANCSCMQLLLLWSVKISLSLICVAIKTSDNTIDMTASVDSMTSTSSSIVLMVTVSPPIDTRREDNDDSDSDIGGIVIGCIVAFIIFVAIVVCLIIFLIWYHAKQKRMKSGLYYMYVNIIASMY